MKITRYMIIMVSAFFFLFGTGNKVEAYEETTKIHFISLYGSTDAILLESDGHYGMVDSGEDWDYPNGEDPKYPLRDGISKNVGYEQQVIHYLEKMGVQKLDFYIGTHAHSDHIGSGDEILDHFPTDRLYISEYDDSYQLDAHGKDPTDPYYYPEAKEYRLWDNQYVYDKLIASAKRNGVEIISDLDLDKNAQYRNFTMGKMQISIMNYERKRDSEGKFVPVIMENENSLVVKVSAYGKNALLTSDIDPTEGATGKLADELIEQLWDTEGIQGDDAEEIESVNYQIPYTLNEEDANAELPDDQEANRNESEPNLGKKIRIDLMKMAHHSLDYNNTTYFLTSLNPKTAIVTGYMSWFNERMKECLPNTEVFGTTTDSAAVVSEFSAENGLTTRYIKIEPEWSQIDEEWYYFNEDGRTVRGWNNIDGKRYYFDMKGIVQIGWKQIENNRYYMNSSGEMQTGWQYIGGKWYYMDDSGKMQTGWQYIGGKWYYMDDSGKMQTGWRQIGNKWYYMNKSGEMQTGWQYIGGKWYYMDDSGKMQTGWKQIENKWYYMNKSGEMQTGWRQIENKWYYMNKSGEMQIGWKRIGDKWYYMNESGEMQIGWQRIEQKWYYLYKNGTMAYNVRIGKYYLGKNGQMK